MGSGIMEHEQRADLPYLKKIVGASMAGTVVEWYEFFLYGTAATLVFGQLFFPETGNELDGIIAAFATYAVGFLARPLRSEEHTSELQSLMRISYAVFCL